MGHSANFDERQFVDPDRFNVERNPNKHLSFGHGIHFCLGAPLARLELRILIQKIIERLPNMHIQDDQPLRMVDSQVMFGPKRLPVIFTASS
jgi:cytochrome P450